MALASFSSIALDLGSTSIKAGLLDWQGTLRHIVVRPAPAVMSRAERYESDALGYAQTAEQVLTDCLVYCGTERPLLGLSCQRSSFLIWERNSGRPVTPLISWQDSRGTASCKELHPQEELISQITGLRLTPYYFAPKLHAVLRQNPEWRERLLRGAWMVGTLDTYLIWRWSSGSHYMTDASMAARTLLMDINEQQWSPVLCALFEIPIDILPQLKPSAGLNVPLHNGLVLQASVGDQSAALIASVGDDGTALVNLGTGGFVVRYAPSGDLSAASMHGYLHTLVYQDDKRHVRLAMEGTLNSIAAALAPYPVKECKISELATLDIFCLAEPSGLGAPYFRNDLGLQFSDSIAHLAPREIAALLLEAIVFRVVLILEEFHRESFIERAYLSGGLSELTCLQQGIALCAPCEVYRLVQKESSLQGAALLASGVMFSLSIEADKIVWPGETKALLEKYTRWKKWLTGLLAASA